MGYDDGECVACYVFYGCNNSCNTPYGIDICLKCWDKKGLKSRKRLTYVLREKFRDDICCYFCEKDNQDGFEDLSYCHNHKDLERNPKLELKTAIACCYRKELFLPTELWMIIQKKNIKKK